MLSTNKCLPRTARMVGCFQRVADACWCFQIAIVHTAGAPVGIRFTPAHGVQPGHTFNHRFSGKLLMDTLDIANISRGALQNVEISYVVTAVLPNLGTVPACQLWGR